LNTKKEKIILCKFLEKYTFIEKLNKQDLFKYRNLYSFLKGRNISEEEYNYYKE
jgi:hypothetical protein